MSWQVAVGWKFTPYIHSQPCYLLPPHSIGGFNLHDPPTYLLRSFGGQHSLPPFTLTCHPITYLFTYFYISSGHSERRTLFQDNDGAINQKVITTAPDPNLYHLPVCLRSRSFLVCRSFRGHYLYLTCRIFLCLLVCSGEEDLERGLEASALHRREQRRVRGGVSNIDDDDENLSLINYPTN